ncbi:MAG TPA: hypothetical protein VHC20_05560 [Candidatus Paceibacterota bacterium]|nr:hypothetical protein [Candidatus Paceibacterota bacterium]
MSHSLSKFERWFAGPIRLLSAIGSGDGAFVALSVSFALFERYVKSDLKRSGRDGSPPEFFARSAQLAGLDEDLFKKFWGMFRDGIQHYLQPKTFESKGVKYGWSVSADYPAMPYYLVDTPDDKTIAFDPWKWTDFVLGLYEKDPSILDILESHSLGHVYHRGSGAGSDMTTLLILPQLLCDDEQESSR